MPRAKAFAKLSTRVLECRQLNHSWSHKRSTLEDGGLVMLHFQCSRCRTQRVDLRIRASGALEGRAYTYAEGYLIEDPSSWGGRKVFNANVSKELIERYLGGKGAGRRRGKQ